MNTFDEKLEDNFSIGGLVKKRLRLDQHLLIADVLPSKAIPIGA